MTTGERIKKRRKELGITADNLGAEIGVDRSTIYRYEKGDIEKLPVSALEPLAEALRTSVAYLMGWTEDPIDYEGGDLTASIPQDLVDLFNGDTKRAYSAWVSRTTLDLEKLAARTRAVLSAYCAADPSMQAQVDELLNIKTRPVLSIENEPRYRVRFAGRDGSVGEKFLTKEEIEQLQSLPDADDL